MWTKIQAIKIFSKISTPVNSILIIHINTLFKRLKNVIDNYHSILQV